MRRILTLCLAVLPAVVTLATAAPTPRNTVKDKQLKEFPRPEAPLPADLIGQAGPLRSAAALDTFVLHRATFNTTNGQPTTDGYVSVDMTAQLATFFHVADNTELTGGTSGALVPLNGTQSMWCGKAPAGAVPYCGYASLPGYGNGWDQILLSNAIPGDSVSISYNVFWDCEGGWDGTVVEYTFDGGATWTRFPVTDTLSMRPKIYDNTGLAPYITETCAVGSSGATNVQIRFRFTSDGAWSDEDGLHPTDGAIIVDDIAVSTWSGGVAATSDTEDFEDAAPGTNGAGIWTATTPPSFGDYAALYPGVSLLQEDPCEFVSGFVWGFFDDPAVTNYSCHEPDPRPDVGAVPFISADGLYMNNQIWSPPFANIGAGVEYVLTATAYMDLPLDNLVVATFHVRSWTAGCPGPWRDLGVFYFGGWKVWATGTFSLGALIDPGADQIQVALGIMDGCKFWCNIYGSGACHSHAPLIDEIRVDRIAAFGPQFAAASPFQDAFAEDGTLSGSARADGFGGDEIDVVVSPVGTDPVTGIGPAVYTYVAVWPLGQTGKTPADMEAPETRPGAGGTRWPLVGTEVDGSGVTWACYRMDSAFTTTGVPLSDRYEFDLNDDVFTPGDTVCYFFGADADGLPGNGNESYFTGTLEGHGDDLITGDIDKAFANPMEFTILPAGGFNRGGDILFVDRSGGSSRLFFDSAFDMLGIGERIDRYDGFRLSSSVKDYAAQFINVYKTVIWRSGGYHDDAVGDDNWALLYQFLNTSDKGPGLYLTGDGLAEDWASLGGAGLQVRSSYMNFNLLSANHVAYGEDASPTLTATGASFIHPVTGADQLVAYGGCPFIVDFDVLQPTGTAVTEFPYPRSGDGAVISQQTLNSAGETATVVLSGFSYRFIRDALVAFPPARVEHLKDILVKMGTIVPDATGIVADGPRFTNVLENSYPNPFNPTTTIRYGIKERAHVSLKVYNAAGQLVRTLVDEVQSPDQVGPVTWDGSNNAGQTVSSGVYFYKLVSKNFSQTKKMVLLK